MDRLTEKRDGQNVIPLRQNGKTKWALLSAGLGDAPTQFLYGEHANRLADYEDTGMEPQEIKRLQTEWKSVYNSNGDAIRQMLDEELAEWLSDMHDSVTCPNNGAVDCNPSCKKCWLDWLKQEVQDETD